MKKIRALTIALLASSFATSLAAAEVNWQVTVVPADAKPGDTVEVVFTADIAPGWILYSSDFKLDIGPLPTRFTFDTSSGLSLVGPIQPMKPQWKNDRSLGGKYSYFSQHAEFRQKARVVAPLENVSGRINGQTCFEENGLCKLFGETFSTHR
jgi:cytochrome c biogenesis DsbD-like protein